MSRGKHYTPEQIIKILREVEIYSGRGQTAAQGCRHCNNLTYLSQKESGKYDELYRQWSFHINEAKRSLRY